MNTQTVSPYVYPLLDGKRYRNHTPQSLIHTLAKKFNMNISNLLMPNRRRNFVEVNMIIAYLLRSIFSITLEEIGELQRRDHATIKYRVETCRILYNTDHGFKVKFNQALNSLNLPPVHNSTIINKLAD